MTGFRDVHFLTGDKRSREARRWPEWLRKVPPIRRRFGIWGDEHDPFSRNETASVAVLANAASMAGYLALTEYVSFKRHTTRGRPLRHGRCDLWLADRTNENSWAFEFKQHFAAPNMKGETFRRHLNRAKGDAKSVHCGEADFKVGCLIMVPRHDDYGTPSLIGHFDELCKDEAELAFRIGGGHNALWLAFSFV